MEMEEILIPLTDNDDIYREIVKKHLNDRRIIINEEISDALLESVCLMILRWNQEDKNMPIESRKKIYIYLNSNGGDAIIGNSILSVIVNSKTPVITVGFAKCFSMASYILAAGHKRYCFANTVVLMHDGDTSYSSSRNKGKDIQKFYDSLFDRIDDFMVQHTSMDKYFLNEIKDREYFIFAEEAKEKGIVDSIIGIDCDIDEIL